MSNQILTIHPYRSGGVWVFDDPDVGIKREPFVGEINDMIDLMVGSAGIENANRGFTALFSHEWFPKYDMMLIKWKQENGGTWYWCPRWALHGWLCPALFKYFPVAPDRIFVKALPMDHKNLLRQLWKKITKK